jgi:hypothetical protein
MTVILSCSGSEAADPTLDPSPQADLPGTPNVEATIAAALELGALPDA